MSESTNEMLAQVEDALWLGDQRTAGILLNKILLQDFTNHQTWLLLYSMRGQGQPLEEFQRNFAQRYYPHLAHLLQKQPRLAPTKPDPVPPDSSDLLSNTDISVPESEPAIMLPESHPGELESLPEEPELSPAESDLLPEELDLLLKRFASRPSEPHIEEPTPPSPEPQLVEPKPQKTIRNPYCPTCEKVFKPDELFCDTCGAPLFKMVEELHKDFSSSPQQPALGTPVVKPGEPATDSSAIQSPKPELAAPAPPIDDTQPVFLMPEVSAAEKSTIEHTLPITPAQPTPDQTGLLSIICLTSPILEGTTFFLWIDGKQQDPSWNGHESKIWLPVGQHSVLVKWRDKASEPVTVDIKPNKQVWVSCKPEGKNIAKISMKLKQMDKPPVDHINRGLSPLLMAIIGILVFIIASIGIGVIVYYLYQLGMW